MANRPVLGMGTYAGIPCLTGQFTLSHGSRPSAATVYFLRNQVVPPFGDLIIDGTDEFGNACEIPFRSCFVDNIQATAGGDPTILVRILDRRWAWDFAAISGHYNIHTESGDSIYNEKTPRELAAICLQVMGETTANLGDFNPEGRPQIDWELVNPARALEEIVNQFGYRIVLGIDNRVHLCRTGVGDISNLQRFTWLEDTVGVDLPKRPDGVIVAAGRTLWNMQLWLEPVGLELNGNWVNIDELSYMPTSGWGSTALPECPANLVYPDRATNDEKNQIKQLAIKHVFRTYRICVRRPPHWTAIIQNNQTTRPPYGEYMSVNGVTGKVKHRWQLLPLEKTQNLKNNTALKPGEKAGNTLVPKRRDPQIFGYFNSGSTGRTDQFATQSDVVEATKNSDDRVYRLPYEIDFERGLVHFECSTHAIIAKKKIPALLTLTIATGIRDEKTRAWKRHTIEHRFAPPLNAGMMVIAHEEVQLRWAKDQAAKYISNKVDVERELRYYLNAALVSMEQRAARSGTFAGMIPIEPSGLVQQITWAWGSNGPTTQFSANTEHNFNVPNYQERRLLNKLKDDKRRLAAPPRGGSPGSPGNGSPT